MGSIPIGDTYIPIYLRFALGRRSYMAQKRVQFHVSKFALAPHAQAVFQHRAEKPGFRVFGFRV